MQKLNDYCKTYVLNYNIYYLNKIYYLNNIKNYRTIQNIIVFSL